MTRRASLTRNAVATALALACLVGSARSLGAQDTETGVLTEAPNLCEVLPPADASQLLGVEVGEGMRSDVAGWPCVYETDGQRLTVVAHLGRGPELEGTQPGIELDYCAAEAVTGIENLGVDATLFRKTNPDCGGGHTLWVATDIRFEGEQHGVPREGQVHLVLTLEPEEDPDRRLAVLERAARHVMDALRMSG